MNNKLFITLLATFLPLAILSAQDITITKNGERKEIYFDRSEACDKEMIFKVVEQPPEYRGGLKKLVSELNQALIIDKKINEQFVVNFTVNCKGKAFGFQIIRGSKHEITEETLGALENLQNWQAGKQGGKEIDFFIAYQFKIKKGKIKLAH